MTTTMPMREDVCASGRAGVWRGGTHVRACARAWDAWVLRLLGAHQANRVWASMGFCRLLVGGDILGFASRDQHPLGRGVGAHCFDYVIELLVLGLKARGCPDALVDVACRKVLDVSTLITQSIR